ncbi:MAG TPA: GTP cyclohydrolase [Saprospiraceae bacterium]|nr:GTP cyclohydrolase [Saprospiraceae bacterium]
MSTKNISKLAESEINTKFGKFQEHLYGDGQNNFIAITMGNISGSENVLCRVHSTCIYGHYFNNIDCDCQSQLDNAQRLIQAEGRGIIILLDQEGKGNGHLALMKSKVFKDLGYPQSKAYEAAGFRSDARDYAGAAFIIKDLKIDSIVMITDNVDKIKTLTDHDVKVIDSKTAQI